MVRCEIRLIMLKYRLQEKLSYATCNSLTGWFWSCDPYDIWRVALSSPMDLCLDVDSIISIVRDDLKLRYIPWDAGEPEGWSPEPVLVYMCFNGKWESQRNGASGQVYSTYRAMDPRRATTDTSGQSWSKYQATDHRSARTDDSSEQHTIYQAMNRGWVGALLPPIRFRQIVLWNVGRSELSDTWRAVVTVLSRSLPRCPPLILLLILFYVLFVLVNTGNSVPAVFLLFSSVIVSLHVSFSFWRFRPETIEHDYVSSIIHILVSGSGDANPERSQQRPPDIDYHKVSLVLM